MKLKSIIIITLSLLTLIILSACSSSQQVSELDPLAQCLTDSGVIMYGTNWCPHCTAQKEMFGSSFQYINFVDCDENSQACNAAGVRGYPTWTIKGANYEGEQTLYDLAKNSGCSLSQSKP